MLPQIIKKGRRRRAIFAPPPPAVDFTAVQNPSLGDQVQITGILGNPTSVLYFKRLNTYNNSNAWVQFDNVANPILDTNDYASHDMIDIKVVANYSDGQQKKFAKLAYINIDFDLVNTHAEFDAMSSTGFYLQNADMDFSDYEHTPKNFDGVYNGNFKKIEKIESKTLALQSTGLFGRVKSKALLNIIAEINLSSNYSSTYSFGGLIGLLSGSSITHDFNIYNIYVYGSIENIRSVGGILGQSASVNTSSLNICNCYSNVAVNGVDAGGLIGNNYDNSFVENCYSVGSVVGSQAGGLIGSDPAPQEVTSSYYDSEKSGQSDTGKGTPKTTAEMFQKATYAGWDFEDVWEIDEENNYPKLIQGMAIPVPQNYSLVDNGFFLTDDGSRLTIFE